jgi:hypothetical protein
MNFELLWKWLLAAVALSALLALSLIFLPTSSLYASYNASFARAFWAAESLPPQALRHGVRAARGSRLRRAADAELSRVPATGRVSYCDMSNVQSLRERPPPAMVTFAGEPGNV